MPNLKNTPTIESLQAMPLADLRQYAGAVNAAFDDAKAEKDTLTAALRQRFGGLAASRLRDLGKDAGKVTIPLSDGQPAQAEIDKTVKWDSKALMKVAEGMPFADVLAFFKIEFAVPEATYKSLLPSDPKRAAIDAARTVKYGEPKITLTMGA
jgi:hypothetical protein